MKGCLLITILAAITITNTQIITYIWVGDGLTLEPPEFPDKYRKKLNSLDYPWELILNCDFLIEGMEKELGRRIIWQRMVANKRSDLCRFIYLYRFGGTYSDLDIDLDYGCFLEVIKQQSSAYGDDIYFMHERYPKNPGIYDILLNFDSHVLLNGWAVPGMQVNQKIVWNPNKASASKTRNLNVGGRALVEKCIVHHADRTYDVFNNRWKIKDYLTFFGAILLISIIIYEIMRLMKKRRNSKKTIQNGIIVNIEEAPSTDPKDTTQLNEEQINAIE